MQLTELAEARRENHAIALARQLALAIRATIGFVAILVDFLAVPSAGDKDRCYCEPGTGAIGSGANRGQRNPAVSLMANDLNPSLDDLAMLWADILGFDPEQEGVDPDNPWAPIVMGPGEWAPLVLGPGEWAPQFMGPGPWAPQILDPGEWSPIVMGPEEWRPYNLRSGR